MKRHEVESLLTTVKRNLKHQKRKVKDPKTVLEVPMEQPIVLTLCSLVSRPEPCSRKKTQILFNEVYRDGIKRRIFYSYYYC